MSVKYELQNIISGNGSVRNGKVIQSIAGYLRGKKEAVFIAEKRKLDKFEETKILIEYISVNQLWFGGINSEKYIGEGAEQKIFEATDPIYVLKQNDSIFYSFWEDYFHSLLIHNYFFSHLAYELCGFQMVNEVLVVVVKQPYVKSTEKTELSNVKEFLNANGFLVKKNNDYYHPELGIILEDLHDENVLTSNGVLQFIDTVFYLTDSFYL